VTQQVQKQLNETAEALVIPIKEHTRKAAEQDIYIKQAEQLEKNQQMLENAYQSYEASLQNLVQSLGDGMGAYFKLHGQSAAQAVNDALAGNIEKLVNLLQRKDT
jgi:hypothetical protein